MFIKYRYLAQTWFLELKIFLSDIKSHIWNKRILLWWYRLWIRKDEFHDSLDIDLGAAFVMNDEELKKYKEDLYRRRDIAHRRDFEKT